MSSLKPNQKVVAVASTRPALTSVATISSPISTSTALVRDTASATDILVLSGSRSG
ncbi:uncharacterized protein METZ01_LOCUS229578 [marine metagenome]|uniref:Uncharacterized protein n=1 Tax=marine metagenome TaxID=408172 RepID=A0A382GPI1_9ZZZZ